jgi:hypothetical protein
MLNMLTCKPNEMAAILYRTVDIILFTKELLRYLDWM